MFSCVLELLVMCVAIADHAVIHLLNPHPPHALPLP